MPYFFEENDKPVCFTNYTRYTLEKMKRLTSLYHYQSRLLIVFLSTFFILVSGLTIVTKVLAKEPLVNVLIPTIPSFFILLLIIALWLYVTGQFYSPKDFQQDTRLAQEGVYYTFTEQRVLIRTTQPGVEVNMHFDYSILYAVHETESDFFLFTQQKRAYIVDKNGFTTGTAEELKEVLMQKIAPDRYVIYA